ncbi:MAG TPA: DoxX family protein [Longimicrobiales bacterium]|nr:DoxX family protein [Longimicrobiales bacterium]
MSDTRGRSRKAAAALWSVQVLLALLFLFAGGMKLVLPIEALTGQMQVPGAFVRFIGVCEVLGALGLVLPGLLHVHEELTPLAARGLAIIMTGAIGATLAGGSVVGALLPLVVGLLATLVASARSRPTHRAPRHAHDPAPGAILQAGR